LTLAVGEKIKTEAVIDIMQMFLPLYKTMFSLNFVFWLNMFLCPAQKNASHAINNNMIMIPALIKPQRVSCPHCHSLVYLIR